MKHCGNCGIENVDYAKFCENCGQALEAGENSIKEDSNIDINVNGCPSCGFNNDEDARFCENCGFNLKGGKDLNNDSNNIFNNENSKNLSDDSNNNFNNDSSKNLKDNNNTKLNKRNIKNSSNKGNNSLNSLKNNNNNTVQKKQHGKVEADNKSEKSSISLGLVVVLIAVIFGGYKYGEVAFSRENQEKKFIDAISQKKTETLTSILKSDDPNLKITKESVEHLVDYYSDNKSKLSELQSNLSIDDYTFNGLTMEKQGKKMFFYDRYVVKVDPVYATVNTNKKGAVIYLDGKEVVKSNSDGFSKEIGPYIPGKYTFKAEYKDSKNKKMRVSSECEIVPWESSEVNLDFEMLVVEESDIRSIITKFYSEFSDVVSTNYNPGEFAKEFYIDGLKNKDFVKISDYINWCRKRYDQNEYSGVYFDLEIKSVEPLEDDRYNVSYNVVYNTSYPDKPMRVQGFDYKNVILVAKKGSREDDVDIKFVNMGDGGNKVYDNEEE
jgi:uncharacterized membrane protein YvbJ